MRGRGWSCLAVVLFLVVAPVDYQVGRRLAGGVSCGKLCGLVLDFISRRTYAPVRLAMCVLVDSSLCQRIARLVTSNAPNLRGTALHSDTRSPCRRLVVPFCRFFMRCTRVLMATGVQEGEWTVDDPCSTDHVV